MKHQQRVSQTATAIADNDATQHINNNQQFKSTMLHTTPHCITPASRYYWHTVVVGVEAEPVVLPPPVLFVGTVLPTTDNGWWWCDDYDVMVMTYCIALKSVYSLCSDRRWKINYCCCYCYCYCTAYIEATMTLHRYYKTSAPNSYRDSILQLIVDTNHNLLEITITTHKKSHNQKLCKNNPIMLCITYTHVFWQVSQLLPPVASHDGQPPFHVPPTVLLRKECWWFGWMSK